jgi:predicted Zn-dependent protease
VPPAAPESLARAARTAIGEGRVLDALALWQQYRDRHPDDPAARIGLGKALREAGRLDEADAVLQDAVNRFPQELWVHFNYALVANRKKDWPEAVRRWEALRDSFPHAPQGYTGLGVALSLAARPEEAEIALGEAVRRFPDKYWARFHHACVASLAQRWQQAAERWNQVRAQFPDLVVEEARRRWPDDDGIASLAARLEAARRLLGLRSAVAEAAISVTLQDPQTAAALEETLGSRPPDASGAYQTAAKLLREAGHPQAADDILCQAARRFPADLWLAVDSAKAAVGRGDLAEAQHRWSAVIDRFPGEPVGYSGLGRTLLAAGDLDAAETLLCDALARFPADLWIPVFYARTATVREDWPAACRRWAIVRAAHPDYQPAWLESGEALCRAGRLVAAEALLYEATTRFSDSEELRIRYEELACRHRSWADIASAWTAFQQQFPLSRSTCVDRRTELRQKIALARPRLPATSPCFAMLAAEQWLCGTVISEEPVIILAAESPLHGAAYTAQYYGDRPVYYLSGMLWSAASDKSLRKQFAGRYRSVSATYPNISVTILANDAAELEALRSVSVPAELVNHNAFVDERLFRIMDDVPQIYDAVYNAIPASYKRHRLAADIDRLLLIVGRGPKDAGWDPLRHILADADIANLRDGAYRHLRPPEITRALNSAKCGLCLSAVEGAMFSSIEYLLCGLPIVNTPNAGGRDWFFSEDYVVTCEDNPPSVKAAVQLSGSRAGDIRFREFVRESTIRRILRERKKFYGIVNRILAGCGQENRRIEDEFPAVFFDKLNYAGQPLGKFLVP